MVTSDEIVGHLLYRYSYVLWWKQESYIIRPAYTSEKKVYNLYRSKFYYLSFQRDGCLLFFLLQSWVLEPFICHFRVCFTVTPVSVLFHHDIFQDIPRKLHKHPLSLIAYVSNDALKYLLTRIALGYSISNHSQASAFFLNFFLNTFGWTNAVNGCVFITKLKPAFL